jgi:hypothetical protein
VTQVCSDVSKKLKPDFSWKIMSEAASFSQPQIQTKVATFRYALMAHLKNYDVSKFFISKSDEFAKRF